MVDGVVTRLLGTIEELVSSGNEVLVVAPFRSEPSYQGVPVVRLPGLPFALYPEKTVCGPSLELKRRLALFQPEVIHAVNPIDIGAIGVATAKIQGIPLVCSYHARLPEYTEYYHIGFLKPATWATLRLLHNRAQVNLATSQAMVQELRDHGIQRVRLWERGIDAKRFGPQHYSTQMREKLLGGRDPKTPVLLYVGRLGWEKGLDQLRPLLARRPDIQLAFVGDGPARLHLQKAFEGTSTVFTGKLEGEALAQAYASADALLFPSTTETLGLVVLEAMASGLPVIAARNGPLLETIRPYENGLMFTPGDVEDMANQIDWLVLHEQQRQQMGYHAYRFAQSLGWRVPTQQLLEDYQRAIRRYHRQNKVRRPAASPARERI